MANQSSQMDAEAGKEILVTLREEPGPGTSESAVGTGGLKESPWNVLHVRGTHCHHLFGFTHRVMAPF